MNKFWSIWLLTAHMLWLLNMCVEVAGDRKRFRIKHSNPFEAPCIFLTPEPAAFTPLSVPRPWSWSETFCWKVMHHFAVQGSLKKRKKKKRPVSTRCYTLRSSGIFKGRRVDGWWENQINFWSWAALFCDWLHPCMGFEGEGKIHLRIEEEK